MLGRLKKHIDTPSTAKDECVFAIGDVHGCIDLLDKLIKNILGVLQARQYNNRDVRLIFLGDIIDRGFDSLACLEAVHFLRSIGAELVLGNHEDLLLRTLSGDGYSQNIWLEHGGLQALKAFDVRPPEPGEDSFDFGDRLRNAIPSHLVTMLEEAPLTKTSGDYLFVHAGLRPGIAIKKQTREDLLFIRREFTESNVSHSKVVVHGHTISETVDIRKNRIAVDTGAYKTGRLSCIMLDGQARRVISVDAKS